MRRRPPTASQWQMTANDGHPSQRPTSRPHRRRAGAGAADESPHAIGRHTHRRHRHRRREPREVRYHRFVTHIAHHQAMTYITPMTDTPASGLRAAPTADGRAPGRPMIAPTRQVDTRTAATAAGSPHCAAQRRVMAQCGLPATHTPPGCSPRGRNSRARVVAQRRPAEAQTETAWRAHSRCAGPAESCSTRRRAGFDERRCHYVRRGDGSMTTRGWWTACQTVLLTPTPRLEKAAQ